MRLPFKYGGKTLAGSVGRISMGGIATSSGQTRSLEARYGGLDFPYGIGKLTRQLLWTTSTCKLLK